MRGSLDNPPIIIRQSQVLPVGFLIAFLALFGYLAIFVLPARSNEIWIYGLLTVIIALIIAFIGVIARPGALTIAPEGLTLTTRFATLSCAWSDIDCFEMVSPLNSYKLPRQPGIVFAATAKDDVWGRKFMELLDGPSRVAALGTDYWESWDDELLEILNGALARWKKA